MKKILYAPLGWLLKGVALLPFGTLYVIADFVYVLLYYVIRYRRKVVVKNISESFPDKSHEWHARVVREFYHNFADYIFETIKLLHVSDAEMMKRMEFVGVDMMDDILTSGRSITAYFSHCGNWEWAPSITLHSRFRPGNGVEFCQVYRPLRNEWFDSEMLRIRSRFGSLSFKKSQLFRDLIKLRRNNIVSITGFMSDQKPSHGDTVHVVEFLNHPTAVITGTATVAHRLSMAVIYWDMEKISRGHYRITMRLISPDASSDDPLEITDRYIEMLETTIRRNPSIWLWSHKRWKNPVTFADNTK